MSKQINRKKWITDQSNEKTRWEIKINQYFEYGVKNKKINGSSGRIILIEKKCWLRGYGDKGMMSEWVDR